MTDIVIAVGEADFDPASHLARLEALSGGAVASFTGIVRGGDGLIAMRLDHYPAMTEGQIARIVEDACARWPLLGVVAAHRVGELRPGERIVFVGTASAHRAAALEACAFLIDWLKTSAPFWKKERFADGRSEWVEARAEDDTAAERWRQDVG
ncbi:MAG: molybdenum cofactor biosynthesis protein MoaE [Sphingobium sp.]|nr:molybdenum cofactor biosynthesis protein MoaE [Sphingobium sp.]MBP6112685.1 molybdenum cofactor biosynthesis protein MoaE [Sphingobium sp.]MBP8672016.1 molybdenum cofactor biosynthesis protein MoaE [Sphingobium sp.]MBP9158433.1 molybdenum cofactor biosynthesis protein MoaE [Sphingobium sp.]